MIRTRVDRADGRYLYYYSFDAPPPPVLDVPPLLRSGETIELRRDPLLDEDVIVSTARQDRTFLPPAEFCPLCPTPAGAETATEVPSTSYEIAVFENRFPSFRADAPDVADTTSLERRTPARGVCEVVLYAPRHDATLGSLPEAQVRRLVDVWADRYEELSARPEVRYVFIFENRGQEIGVTLTHPHGQIYTFPFVPPRVRREHEASASHQERTGRCLHCDVVVEELSHGRRLVATAEGFAAYVPFAARLPYEVHVTAVAHRPSLLDLYRGERDGLARLLRIVQAKYDNLWGFPMPFTMSMHQRATDGIERSGEHLHIEFAPPYRSRDKLKYLAGVETGAGTFINDTAPEEKAQELREAEPRT
ncbi:MAG: galactose-1-phosphate uridylyltransferase [Dehalococcoidia bacterium]